MPGSDKKSDRRIRERLGLKLPVRVHCRETPDFEWVEITHLIDVTPFGAGLTLKHPCEKGRLLHMTIPMPRQLRVFDHVEDQYRVWVLVRYMLLETLDENNVVAQSENTVTENISVRGSMIFTSLDISSGRFVRLTSQQYNPVFAAVRSSSKGEDGMGRIFVEFIDRQWPL